MPIYEYYCSKCEKKFEILEPVSDGDVEKPCPECTSVAQRMISAAAFHFKGSGWYSSDYKTKNDKKDIPKDIPPCAAAKGAAPACKGCVNAVAGK